MKTARKLDLETLFCLGLVLAVVVVYFRVLGYGFVGVDDDRYVYGNPMVRDGFVAGALRHAFSYGQHNWHPLTWLSLQFDAQLFGLRPEFFHLTNIGLHAASAVLLFLALRALSGRPWPSAFAAALFALHPLNVESVAWVAERKNVLSTFFWMLGMYAYARYAQRPSPGRYGAVAACLAMGFMAKASVMTMPVALLVLDYWPLRRFSAPEERAGKRWTVVRGLVLEKIPLLGIAAAGAILALNAIAETGGEVAGVPLTLRVGQALVAAVTYLIKMVWPSDLAFFHPYPQDLPAWQVEGAALLMLAVTAATLAAARNRPYFLAGWLWFLVTLGPMYGLVQSGKWPAYADRYVYLPQVGVFMAVAFAACDLVGGDARKRTLAAVLGGVVLAALSAATWTQSANWKDSRTLFVHALEVTTDNWFAHAQLGVILAEEGDFAAAREQYSEALRIKPDYDHAKYNLGILLFLQKNYLESRAYFKEVSEAQPGNHLARFHYALCLQGMGRNEEALSELSFIVSRDPDFAPGYVGLGRLYWAKGRPDIAAAFFKKVLVKYPGYSLARLNLEALRRAPESGPPADLAMSGQLIPARGQGPDTTASGP